MNGNAGAVGGWPDTPDRPTLGRPLILGLTVVAAFFGVFGGWAVFARLATAAPAQGQLRVESHSKTLQHLEGGIIRSIAVREGQRVAKGQTLVVLDDTQAGAANEMVARQHLALKAAEARLVAERDGLSAIPFPAELLARRNESEVAKILAGQQTIFAARRGSLSGEGEVLEHKIGELRAEIGAYEAQRRAAERQIVLVKEEAETSRQMLEKGLERKPRYLALQRQLAELEGTIGQQTGLIARANQAISEARLQRSNLGRREAKEVSAELREVQIKLTELEERLRSASDIRSRTVIVAPQSGVVANLRFVTTGAVIRPGEPVLDVVPDGEALIVTAQVAPLHVEAVRPGLAAEVRLPGLKQRGTPLLIGRVRSISADALSDPRTGQSHYLAEIELPGEQLRKLKGADLRPGMPAEVFIVTGRRAPIAYLTDPLRDSFARAMRED
jgi:HlyD family type I secretion membrane fusion protein